MVLAGLADGRICHVDPTTLELTTVVQASGGVPKWFGWYAIRENRPAGLIVATRQKKPVVREGKQSNESFSMIHDLATGKSFAMDHLATTFLFDRAGRFWVGADHGEWGGSVTRIDLNTGKLATIEPPPSRNRGQKPFWRGVYGFVELRDGQIWPYGGTYHMGINEGEITRVDEAPARTMAEFDASYLIANESPTRSCQRCRSRTSSRRINGLLVFSFSDLFRVDQALKAWKKAGTLEITYRWGTARCHGLLPGG